MGINKKILIWILALLSIVIVAVLIIYLPKANRQEINYQWPPKELQNIPIQTYSSGGTVTKIEEGKIYYQAAHYVNGEIKFSEKIAATDSTTFVYKVLKSQNFKTDSAKFSDIKVGQEISVYTTTDPQSTSQLRAQKIEIIQ